MVSEMPQYRVILIDPALRLITEFKSDCSLDSIHNLVGAPVLGHFGLARHADGGRDTGWVDDNGLSAGLPVHAFLLPTSKDPIAGKCLIIGSDERGETADSQFPLSLLRQDVTWLGKILPEVTWDHTEIGSTGIVTYSRIKE
jgi:hypothetical protein